ncbi:Hydrolase activity protein [Homalodisca vitripennis]|nr:Hydrolase activity protein [Homalodisca vitripennis]
MQLLPYCILLSVVGPTLLPADHGHPVRQSAMLMRVVAVVCLVSCCYGEFTVPEAKLEFINPKGLRISIPDSMSSDPLTDTDPDVTLVAFHVNVNEEFQGVEAGQWAADVLKRRGGRWTYNFPQVKVKKGDTIHYWVYAIRNGLGYQNLDRSYQVTEDNPHGSPGPTTTQKPMPQPPPYPGPTEPPSPLPVDWRNCKLSQTSIRDKAPPCAGRGVFNATFRTIADLSQWQHEIHVGGTHLKYGSQNSVCTYSLDRDNKASSIVASEI